MMGFALLSFWNIWDNGSDRELRCIGSLFSFLEGYPVGGFGNADNWACWVGTAAVVDDRLVVQYVRGGCGCAVNC